MSNRSTFPRNDAKSSVNAWRRPLRRPGLSGKSLRDANKQRNRRKWSSIVKRKRPEQNHSPKARRSNRPQTNPNIIEDLSRPPPRNHVRLFEPWIMPELMAERVCNTCYTTEHTKTVADGGISTWICMLCAKYAASSHTSEEIRDYYTWCANNAQKVDGILAKRWW